MKQLAVTCGITPEIQVDPADWERLKHLTWRYNTKTGVHTWWGRRTHYMHRLITQCPPGMVVDHINHDNRDNRRSNLRVCSVQNNHKNQKKPKNNTSGFKGVTFDSRKETLHKRWRAQIRVNRRKRVLGYFLTKEEAARAYDDAAIEAFGEFADLNFKKFIP